MFFMFKLKKDFLIQIAQHFDSPETQERELRAIIE